MYVHDVVLGNQYKINVMFTGTRIPIQTYGRIHILFIDKNGLNETHTLTQDVDDLLTSGTQLEKLFVLHPAIIPVEAQIVYVAYDGWIYSGRYQWSLDKVILTDSNGKRMTFCQDLGQLLPTAIPVKIPFKSGECLGTSALSPEYPISTIKKYPKRPYTPSSPTSTTTIDPTGFSISKKRPVNHRLKPSTGRDVVHMTTNLMASSDDEDSSTSSTNTVSFTIHDEVAPLSIPDGKPPNVGFHSHVDQKQKKKTSSGLDMLHELGPAYLLDHQLKGNRPKPPPPPPPPPPPQKKYQVSRHIA
jgi:hypothetical protein